MKIKCPKCKEDAELAPDFSYVECKKCGLDMSYGEYVRFVAHNEAKYSDILGVQIIRIFIKKLYFFITP